MVWPFREKAAHWGAVACAIGMLMAVAGCAQTPPAPVYSPRTVTLEVVAADPQHSSYTVVMQVRDDQGTLIDQARVDGLRPVERKAVDITPRRCRTYNAGFENGAYVPKTLCTGITIKGAFWFFQGVANFSIEQASYTELVRMRTFQPSPGVTLEQAVVDTAKADGGIVFYPPDPQGFNTLRLRTRGVD